jgi:hypothetical protein
MSKKKIKCSLYAAMAMTGKTGKELWDIVKRIQPIYESASLTFISPVVGEGIESDKVKVKDRSDQEMVFIWKSKDKQQIRDTNVFMYMAPDVPSQGVTKEYALARGSCWKPTIGVYIGIKPGFITREEDDIVASSHEEAAKIIAERWGTRVKRNRWRLHMLRRSLLKWLFQQAREFWL